MTREITFRAWILAGTRSIESLNLYGHPRMVYSEDLKFGFLGKDCWISLGEITTRDIALMQYTGLKDKNGKEIYEGDIVQWENYWTCSCGNQFNKFVTKGIVQFWYGNFVASEKLLTDSEHNEPQHLNQFAVSRDKEYDNYYGNKGYIVHKIEVIGNIYEHGHLMEGTNV